MNKLNYFFEIFAKQVTTWVGSTTATVLAFMLVILWTIGGIFEGFSDSYQLIINTGTTIITFLMVFLIQRTQNKDSFALQMKLNELIAAHPGCSNRLINVEDLSEDEIVKLYNRYKKLAKLAKFEDGWTHQHTIEEIEDDD
jgi:low affinity Fe/Cu permease